MNIFTYEEKGGVGMRLVDADALRNELYDADAITMRGVAIINRFPTIDAVEVVRCKDCKHRPKENRSLDGIIWVEFPEEEICPFNCEDPFYNQMPEDDFFCARGERRNDD